MNFSSVIRTTEVISKTGYIIFYAWTTDSCRTLTRRQPEQRSSIYRSSKSRSPRILV